ncbi:MAG: hypothetical protein EXR54_00715 [Dehalococcoidia bacterium]|nr:hypothetical protein [Dehalococcoidia bacterium]MSQ16082.1 hypothetical protein [Dehalococcoidia bacterium]
MTKVKTLLAILALGMALAGMSHAQAQTAATVTISPTIGPVGTVVTVSGFGFTSNESPINIFYAGNLIAAGTNLTASGTTISFQFTIPPTPSSGGSFTGTRAASTVNPATFSILLPGIELSSTSEPPGTRITVTGTNFAVNETGINVTFGATQVATTSASSAGGWNVSFAVPTGSALGSQTVRATGSISTVGAALSKPFTVKAGIYTSRNTGTPGTSVTVTGSGFLPSEPGVTVTYDSATVASSIVVNSQGNWTANFNLPDSAGGAHEVGAFGNTTTKIAVGTVTFTVNPTISLSKTSGPPGTSVTITGAGFAASESSINVTFDGANVASGLRADAKGKWTANFLTPPTPAGGHTVTAGGSSTSSSGVTDITFTVGAGITLSRANGPPGTLITVNGAGFGPGESSIGLTYDGLSVASGISANVQGAWSGTFTVPSSPGGPHILRASGPSAGAAPEVTFTVGAGLSLSRSSGSPGTPVTVGGSGFSPNGRSITLTYDGVPVSPGLAANAQGTWTVNFVVPASPGGTHTFAASSPSLQGVLEPDAVFSVVPGLTISRSSGAPGASLTVNGSGFGASERGIIVSFDGLPVASGISANGQGGWSAVFAVPSTTAGSHTIGASGSATQGFASTEVTFLVAAELTVNRPNASPGMPIIVTGSGFAASETAISITFHGTPVASAITATSQGTWTANFAVPASTAGSHEIRASGSATQAAAAPAISLGVVPVVSISPNTGNVGMKVDITGAGYAANAALAVVFGDGEVRGGGITTDGAGSFGFSLVAPRIRAGAQSIRVSDGLRNDAQATFTVEGVPPRSPSPLAPKNNKRVGLVGGATPTITWSNAQDPSGVTYVLQLDTAPDFPNPILEKFDLTSTSYTLSEGEALSRGRYYWRVRAVDGAYNESPWSDPLIVRSGLIPAWMLVVLVIAGLAATGGAGIYGYLYYFHRKPEVIRVGEVTMPAQAPGYFRELGAPEEAGRPQQRALGLPTRLALPGSTQRHPKVLSLQEQGRLRILVDFARSLPLLQVGYNVGWLEELLRGADGNSPSDEIKEQLLLGRLTPRYDPSWQGHPLYLELRGILDSHPLLQGLDSFMDSINRCAGDSSALLQEVFRDSSVDVPVEALRQGHWQYVFGVYSDSLGWFRGKFLREPTERDYVFKESPAPAAGGRGLMWLQGAEDSPFAGDLLPGVDRSEAQEMLERHMRLRRNYRASERAKDLVETLAQLEVQRDRLRGALDQLSQMGDAR